jgi:hypothetical protein
VVCREHGVCNFFCMDTDVLNVWNEWCVSVCTLCISYVQRTSKGGSRKIGLALYK